MNPSGNVLGLEQNKHDAILIQASPSVRTSELEEWVRPKVCVVVEGTRAFAATKEGGVVPWIYLNYSHPSQDVLQSYGQNNVRLIRETTSRYDPGGVFQHLCPGGFKPPLKQCETLKLLLHYNSSHCNEDVKIHI